MEILKFRNRGRYESKYTNEYQENQSTKGSEKEILKRLGSLIKRTRESNWKTKYKDLRRW